MVTTTWRRFFIHYRKTTHWRLSPSSEFLFKNTGLSRWMKSNKIFVVRTYKLLKEKFPVFPGVSVQIHKTIPMGAGIGGGSSDGHFCA